MELTDQILTTFMVEDKEQGNFFSLGPVVAKHYPRHAPARLAKSLDRLEEKGFIKTSTRKIKGIPEFVKVTSAAYTYFEEKENQRAAWEHRRRSEFRRPPETAADLPQPSRLKFARYYVFGVLSGALLMWVKLAL
jgi:hypothetical protein